MAHKLNSNKIAMKKCAYKKLGVSNGYVALTLFSILFYLLSCEAGAATKIPSTMDESIGRAMFTSEIDSKELVNEQYVNEIITTVLNRIQSANSLPWKVHVAVPNSSEINAHTFGGGYIILPLGMLATCRTDAELAFVLSHEIAHGRLRHISKKIERNLDESQIEELLLLVNDVKNETIPDNLIISSQLGGFLRGAGKVLGKLIRKPPVKRIPYKAPPFKKPPYKPPTKPPVVPPVAEKQISKFAGQAAARSLIHLKPFSRKIKETNYSHIQEKEADILGVKMMIAAGYSGSGAITVLKKLPGADWSSSHPSTSDRVEAISHIITTQKTSHAIPVIVLNFEDIKTSMPEIENAVFGIVFVNKNGEEDFFPTNKVSLVNGQRYGWIIKLKESVAKVRWREEITLPHIPETWGERIKSHETSEDLRTHISEEEAEVIDGFIGNFWTVAPGDPEGEYVIRVYIDDTLVETFRFQVEAI